MTLNEILGVSGAGIFVVLLGLIKIKPLEISIWSWIARKLGKAFNGELFERVTDLDERLEEHITKGDEREALRRRTTILRFADEMYENRYHSRDHFEEIIECIDLYNQYCAEHPGFKNGRTEASARMIREQYEECLQHHSFEKKEEEHEGN